MDLELVEREGNTTEMREHEGGERKLNSRLLRTIVLDADYPCYDGEEAAIAIIEARMLRQINQKQLAAVSGIHQSDISRYESADKIPSINNLRRIASSLNMDLRIEFIPRGRIC